MSRFDVSLYGHEANTKSQFSLSQWNGSRRMTAGKRISTFKTHLILYSGVYGIMIPVKERSKESHHEFNIYCVFVTLFFLPFFLFSSFEIILYGVESTGKLINATKKSHGVREHIFAVPVRMYGGVEGGRSLKGSMGIHSTPTLLRLILFMKIFVCLNFSFFVSPLKNDWREGECRCQPS